MDTNMEASLCERTLDNAIRSYLALRGAVIHSDRGAQYTSETYRRAVTKHGIFQSTNCAGGRCHDNARCKSMWARMKEELMAEIELQFRHSYPCKKVSTNIDNIKTDIRSILLNNRKRCFYDDYRRYYANSEKYNCCIN